MLIAQVTTYLPILYKLFPLRREHSFTSTSRYIRRSKNEKGHSFHFAPSDLVNRLFSGPAFQTIWNTYSSARRSRRALERQFKCVSTRIVGVSPFACKVFP